MTGHQRFSINEASVQDLEQIPGVDHITAETIIEFREQRGWINNLEELTDIQQVDAGEMQHLREWLTTASERTGALEYQGQKEEPDAA